MQRSINAHQHFFFLSFFSFLNHVLCGSQAFLPIVLQGLSTLTVSSDRHPGSHTALEELSRSVPDLLISGGGARSDGGPSEMLPFGGSDDEALPAWAESATHTAVSAHNSRKVI